MGIEYNKQSLDNYIRLYVDGDNIKIKPFLNKQNSRIGEEILPQEIEHFRLW